MGNKFLEQLAELIAGQLAEEKAAELSKKLKKPADVLDALAAGDIDKDTAKKLIAKMQEKERAEYEAKHGRSCDCGGGCVN